MKHSRPRIDEVIVVEGKDDIAAVKRAVDAEIISTHGFGFGNRLKKQLVEISKRKGIIIFTDADYMGKKIRRELTEILPHAKQAHLSQRQSRKKDNIGVENANPEDILKALKNARASTGTRREEFTMEDLMANGLVNKKDSSLKRTRLCDILRIGHGNGKQTLRRLNGYNISRDEFLQALREVENHR